MVHVIGLQERVAYHTCCFIARAILTRGISSLLAAPAMTQDAEHKLTILDACSCVGIVTFKYLKHSIHLTTALNFHGEQNNSALEASSMQWELHWAPEGELSRSQHHQLWWSFTVYLHRDAELPLAFLEIFLKLFRTDNRALEKCFCKFVACVPPGKADKTEFVKFHTHPDLWATSSSSLQAFSICCHLIHWVCIPISSTQKQHVTWIYTVSTQQAIPWPTLPCSNTWVLPDFSYHKKTPFIDVRLVPFNPCCQTFSLHVRF